LLLFAEVENAAAGAPDPCRDGAPGTRLALVSALALLATGWMAIGVPSATAAWSPVWLGSLLVVAGIALRAVAIRTLGPAFTSEIVAAPGRALVTRGVYAWLRHPSEIGLFAVALGIACLGNSAAALGVVATLLAPSILIRVAREDRALGRR
jgi:protein-S-isoprenylcysteine O-methyltransferase